MLLLHRLHYFSYDSKKEVREVYLETLIANLALALVFIFEPIYLYTLKYSLVQIMWFYVIVYLAYVFLIFWGAKFAGKFGYKHSILLSNIFYVIYWSLLYLIRDYSILFFIAPIFFALQKSFFWPAYDADVALNSIKVQGGREVATLFSIVQLMLMVGPLLGGLISTLFGFKVLFAVASVLMLLSVYPLFRSKEIFTRHKFQLNNFWAIAKAYPQNFLGYWGYAEDLMLMSLWPILLFITVPYFFGVGLVSAFAGIVATVLMLYIGKRSDEQNRHYLIERNSILYGLTWVFRFFATGFASILFFDVLTKIGKGLVNVPMMALTFEIAGKKSSDYAIAYSVFYEFSLSVAKLVTALLAIAILSATGNIYLVFATVGLLTMLYSLLKK